MRRYDALRRLDVLQTYANTQPAIAHRNRQWSLIHALNLTNHHMPEISSAPATSARFGLINESFAGVQRADCY
jgi:hypothetical protein